MPEHWDTIIVGGGAAGFFGAITCAESPGEESRVLILEKTKDVLAKVKISGGGRCNVTHHGTDPKDFSQHYPRGEKTLIGPLHRWGADETISWFQEHGVELKTESDGRIFPTTDSSQTIVDCLVHTARKTGVEIRTSCGVDTITPSEAGFTLTTDTGDTLHTRTVLLATGGTRLAAGARLAERLGHTLEPPVPSLFTFKIDDPRLQDLQGLSVPGAKVSIPDQKLQAEGPLLVTHWGLSGPGILRLSAWGARQLAALDYHFTLHVNWLPQHDVPTRLSQLRESWRKRQVIARPPFEEIPKRLWERLVAHLGIPEDCRWSQLPKADAQGLANQLTDARFQVEGKSLNKEEFVTCGGVSLREISPKTMASKLHPGLYFAGEILDVDGLTGGFNFQHAWCSAHHAGLAIAASLSPSR